MTELSRFHGIVITMERDANRFSFRPHVCAAYAAYEITMAVGGEILDGVFPEKQLKLVQAWDVLHEDELYKAWYNLEHAQTTERIQALQ